MRNVSFSELDTAMRCPWRWHLAYVRRLAPAGEVAGYLALGLAGHHYLQNAYRTGNLDAAANWPPEVSDEVRSNLRRIMALYRPQFEADLAVHRVLGTEYRFAVTLPTPQGTRSNYRLIGRVDMVTKNRITGGIWVWDHKFTSSFRKSSFSDYQGGVYAWALARMGLPVQVVAVNHIRTKPSKSKLVRRDTYLKTATEYAAWGDFLYWQCRALPSMRTPHQQLARALDDRCSWDCEYAEICRLTLEGRLLEAREVIHNDFYVRPPRGVSQYQTKLPAAWLKEA